MTPRDRWKEVEIIFNSALDKTEAEKVVSLIKESVRYEVEKILKK
jgi:hypothetical protein